MKVHPMASMDITERLERIGRGEHPDLTDLVCGDAKTEIERLRAWAKDEQQKREAVEEDRLRERQENDQLRAAIPIWMTARGYATGHGDTIEDMLAELETQAVARVIDGAPEPLKRLGERLADLLDADHWNNIEPLLLALAHQQSGGQK
jgi:hypothetical protein